VATSQNQFQTIANEDGAVILDTGRGTILGLNPIGSYIWQALEQGQNSEAIVKNLVRDTGAAQDIVERDVREFMEELEQHHLLQSGVLGRRQP
jgi:hypothetical protein